MDLGFAAQFIIAAVPSLTAVITLVVSLMVGIKKVNNASEKTINEVKDNNKELKEENLYLKKVTKKIVEENAKLKEQLNEILARMKHLYYVENPNEKSNEEE